MKRYDRITSLVCIAVAVAICFQSYRLSLGSWRSPGPGFFSFWTGVLLGGISIIVYLKARLSKSQEEASWFPRKRWRVLVLVLSALFAYALLLEVLGFLMTTFLLLLFLFKVIEPERWIVAIGGSLLTTLCSYALFALWLQVQLPKGLWRF